VRFMLPIGLILLGVSFLETAPAFALPSANDLPEEYLRGQIILEARSPLDGDVISASEYADLMAKLEKEQADRADLALIRYSDLAVLFNPDQKPAVPAPPTAAELYRGQNPYARTSPQELAARKSTVSELLFLLRIRKVFSTFGLQINLR
jgi:hypothetical protein